MRSRADILFDLWPTAGRLFTGLFFLTSAYMKLMNGFFFARTAPLASDWQYWLDRHFTVSWYRPVLEFFMPYADTVAVFVILMHGLAGLLFLLNYRVRLGGLILLIIQLNIWFGTLNGWGFLVMVGCSIWIALYYCAGSPCTQRSWRFLTLGFILLDALMVFGRYTRGDPWISSFSSNLANLKIDAIGTAPIVKHWALLVLSGSAGPWLWASLWWVHVVILLFLFTRYRLQAGSVLLVLFLGRSLLWTNVLGAEAVIYILFTFIWLAEEFRQERGSRPVSLLGIFSDFRSFGRFCLSLLRR